MPPSIPTPPIPTPPNPAPGTPPASPDKPGRGTPAAGKPARGISLSPSRNAAPLKPLSARSAWHLGANAPVLFWFLATFLVSFVHRELAISSWLMVHMTLLGAVANAIVVWSAHFSDALMRRRVTTNSRRWQVVRLVSLNIGVILTIAGMVTSEWLVTLLGAIWVGLAVAAHGTALWWQSRSALTGRFAVCVNFYVAAAWLLPVGAALGVILARGAATGWHARLVLAHAGVNVLGFMGLTVLGTLVTLWPTMLRTTMAPSAPRAARTTLWLMLSGLAIAAASALAGLRIVTALGVLIYLAGIVVSVIPMVASARRRPPASFATWSASAALTWLVACLTTLVVFLVIASSWEEIYELIPVLTIPLVAGFGAQIVLGALTDLIPVVLGGGPAASRATAAQMDRGGPVRVIVANGGLLLFIFADSSILTALSSVAALTAFAAFLPIVGLALRAHRKARKDIAEGKIPARKANASGNNLPPATITPARNSGMALAGLSVLLLIVAGSVALDPTAASIPIASGSGSSSSGGSAVEVTPTGNTTTVEVEARDMRFTPANIEVPAGDNLILLITNTDPTTVHDLALDTGAHSGRIGVGETVTMEVGVVGRSIAGWCTIVGHKQMGMTLTITPTGLPAGSDHDPDAQDPAEHHGTASGPSAADDLDFMATPAEGFTAYDPVLPTLTDEKVRKVTLKVSDLVTDVSPGVSQTMWTFGDTAPGPVLHGRVGDKFEITLINDASIGHSIDFHAGMLAPDEPMRTIAPGETLTYNFTATMSGIWLYHCSTMPMSSHIANGMFGAVVIEPPTLEPVDHSYVMVQSDLYLGPQGGTVDAEKVATQQPDIVAFNGYASQYVFDPLRVRTGERVRFWVLAAGPNIASSFHVVGGQFDTVFHEGAYRLRPNNPEKGGSQALGLSVAQGGFVELVFPEAGTYTFVSHVMSDAEKGAIGKVVVTDP